MSGNQIQIAGDLVRRDREDRNFTREAFRAHIHELSGFQISDSTLRRAERGEASRQTLRCISEAFGFPADRYLARPPDDSIWRSTFDLNGKWRVYYVEDDVGARPYLAVEELYVVQNGSRLEGIYEPIRSDHPEGYLGTDAFVMRGRIAENVLMGRYYREGVAHPKGAGVFQLLLVRNGAWAEGICTFFADDGKVMASLNIWIKESSPEFSVMVRQAEKVMKEKMLLLRFPLSTPS